MSSLKTLVMSQTPTQIKLRLQPASWPAQPEARQAAMREAARQALAERGLQPMREPRLTPAGSGFSCEADLFPPVELPASLSVRLEVPALTPPDETALRLAVEGLQIRLGDALPSAGPAGWGQLLRVDMLGLCGQEPIPLSLQANVPMLLRQDSPAAAFVAQLIGALPGETRVLRQTLGPDYPHQPWRGAAAEYRVRVREILSLSVPAADDLLARATGAGDRFEDLLQVLYDQQRQEARARWRDRLREAVVAQLVKASKVLLPEPWVSEQLKAAWQASDGETVQALAAAGFALPARIEALSWQSWQQPWLRQQQGRNLKTQLVLREVGLKAGLALEARELLRPLEIMALNQQDGDVARHFQSLAAAGEFPNYANQVWLDKIVKWLLDQASLSSQGQPLSLKMIEL